MRSDAVATSIVSARGSPAVSDRSGKEEAACSVTSRASARTSASASRIPEFGETNAAAARMCGSRART